MNRVVFLRALWIALALFAVGLYIVAVPAYYDQLLHLSDPALKTVTNAPDSGAAVRGSLATAGISVQTFARLFVLRDFVFAVIFTVVALFIFFRRSNDVMALVVSLMLILMGMTVTDTKGALNIPGTVGGFAVEFVNLVGFLLFLFALYIFPNGRFVPRWTRWLMLFWAVTMTPNYLAPGSALDYNSYLGDISGLFFFLAPLLSVILAQGYRYLRVSNEIERQQTRWVVLGVALAVGGFVALIIVSQASPDLSRPGSIPEFLFETGFYASISILPLSFAVAILRSRLWDIDVLIRRTLIYGVLTGVLVLVYLVLVTLIQTALASASGQRSEIAIIVSTLAIAALFLPVRQRVQTIIDRRFYRRKYDAAQVLVDFSGTVRDEVDLNQLTDELLVVVEETMQPAHVSLWLRRGAERK